MGRFDGYFKGDKKKLSKEEMAKKAKKISLQSPYSIKFPEVVKKGKIKF